MIHDFYLSSFILLILYSWGLEFSLRDGKSSRRFLRDDPPDFNHGTVGVINMMHSLKEGRDESDFYR